MASSSSLPQPEPPTPTPGLAPKKGFFRRLIPFFLAANLGVGVYVFIKQSADKNKADEEQVTSQVTTESAVSDQKAAVEPIPAAVQVLPPIPEQEQRQLFKWILEKKRKVKPSDPAEKKKLDEEKALLKQFIKAKSVPNL